MIFYNFRSTRFAEAMHKAVMDCQNSVLKFLIVFKFFNCQAKVYTVINVYMSTVRLISVYI